VILNIATLNIVISFFAVLSIFSIILSVMAVIGMFGWEFGISESISVVLVVGFSVDYTVHLGSHYIHSPYEDRYQRSKFALFEMGISILGGAITTIGSGVFLMPCVIIIFHKMAIMIISTIMFSLFYSLIFFVTLTHICGP
jgi:predicted RND superfamily exporter protein